MLAIMSAYVLGILTNRILLIDLGINIHLRYLFCEPFLNSSWIMPKKIVQKILSATNVPMASDMLPTETQAVKIARLFTSE